MSFDVAHLNKLKRDDSGITTMGIFDFLLNENSLDM